MLMVISAMIVTFTYMSVRSFVVHLPDNEKNVRVGYLPKVI